jgi:DNA-binding SARP family transcriptional activator
MDTHHINLLGEFEYIAASGKFTQIDLAKNIGLIAILLMSKDATCSRSRIIDLLWSDRCDEQGRASLRHALWSLKQIFSDNSDQLLLADRKRLQLNLEFCTADVFEFETLCISSEYRDRERALPLYRGEMLDGLMIRDRQWNEWLTTERENLLSRYITALNDLCAFYFAQRAPHALISTGRQLIENDPLCEQGHHAIMAGYFLLNQRSQALMQYRRYELLFKQEFNSLPGPVITGLRDRIVFGTQNPVPGCVDTAQGVPGSGWSGYETEYGAMIYGFGGSKL